MKGNHTCRVCGKHFKTLAALLHHYKTRKCGKR